MKFRNILIHIKIIFIVAYFFIFSTNIWANDISMPVIKYANEHLNYSNSSHLHLEHVKPWNNYEVYEIHDDKCNCTVCGSPRFLLEKDNTVRFAKFEEKTGIFSVNKPQILPNPQKLSLTDYWQLYCQKK